MKSSRVILVVVATLVILVAGVASAHKFYASLAQLERRPDGHVEVSLRVFPDDLEVELRALTGTTVDVADTPEFGAVFERWVNTVFILEDARGARSTFRFVGVEGGAKVAWIHMETDWPAPLSASILTNRILVPRYPKQVNTVNLVEGNTKSALVFDMSTTRADQLMRSDVQ